MTVKQDTTYEDIKLLEQAYRQLLQMPNRDMDLIRRMEKRIYSTELSDSQRYEAIRRGNLN